MCELRGNTLNQTLETSVVQHASCGSGICWYSTVLSLSPGICCSLQDEFTRAQGELKRLLSDRQAQQEKLQLLLAELRGELLDKTRELEDLRLQVNQTQERLHNKTLNVVTGVAEIFVIIFKIASVQLKLPLTFWIQICVCVCVLTR